MYSQKYSETHRYSSDKPRSHRNARQIQNQLDSLRCRERKSHTRNSSLLADISRLKKQVESMNVSENRLERARGNYDRYVETCMVNWVQKAFRETGTDNKVDSSFKQELTRSADQLTPTKTIGVQTTFEPTVTQISDWSISPDTLLHSTMLAPNVSDKLPPRATSTRHNSLASIKPSVDMSSVVPPIINLSDLGDPVPLQDTFSTPAYYPNATFQLTSKVAAQPESPLPIILPHFMPPSSTFSTPNYAQQNTFQSLPNVSMIPQTYLAVPHSYVLPQQPVVYPNPPFSQTIPAPLQSYQMPLSATFQPPVPLPTSHPPVPLPSFTQPLLPLPATSQPPVAFSITSQPAEPISATSNPLVPLLATSVAPRSSETISQQFTHISTPPDLTTTRPLYEGGTESTTLHTLPPHFSEDTTRQQLTQNFSHSVITPPILKSPPPPPKQSILSPSKLVAQMSEQQPTQLSHSRQSSSLPTIPEPFSEPQLDRQPPVAILNTSVGMPRVASAHEFALRHLDNLERRATLDLGYDSELLKQQPTSFDTITASQHLSNSNHNSETNELDSDSSSPDRISHLKSTPNQFDLTALLVSESGSDEDLRRKPSQVMAESPTISPPRDPLLVIKNLASTLNQVCLNTTPGGVKIYDTIPQSDTVKPQLAESNVVTIKIVSQAATSEMEHLASWDVRILSAVFLSEISKFTLQFGPILSSQILSKQNLDLATFNKDLHFGSQHFWSCLLGHFSALFEAQMSLEDICATFVPFLVKPLSSNETIKLAIHVLLRILSEIFDLKHNEDPILSSSSSSKSGPAGEVAYQHLLKSMTLKSGEKGVKSGIEDDIPSVPSSLLSEGSVNQDFYAGISPTQLLEEAVGVKIESESSGTDSVQEGDIYVPSFGASKLMSDREKKTKFEKFWGSDLDSDESEPEPTKGVKKKTSGLDDFDFF